MPQVFSGLRSWFSRGKIVAIRKSFIFQATGLDIDHHLLLRNIKGKWQHLMIATFSRTIKVHQWRRKGD
jgi:hypothetical protein